MTPALLLALLGITVGAFAQAVTGLGFSLVAAPMLILELGPREGVATTVVLAVLASAVPLTRDARQARAGDVAGLLVPTLVCTPVIACLLAGASPRWLTPVAGTAVVLAVCGLACGVRWPWLRRPGGGVATGAVSALLNVVGGVGGPPIALYAANADWSPARTRGNLSCLFLVQNCVTALVLGLVVPGPLHVAAVGLGSALGAALAPRTRAETVRLGVLAVALLGGIGLLAGTG